MSPGLVDRLCPAMTSRPTRTLCTGQLNSLLHCDLLQEAAGPDLPFAALACKLSGTCAAAGDMRAPSHAPGKENGQPRDLGPALSQALPQRRGGPDNTMDSRARACAAACAEAAALLDACDDCRRRFRSCGGLAALAALLDGPLGGPRLTEVQQRAATTASCAHVTWPLPHL